MQEARQKDVFRGHFLIGAFLIIGIYFLGLFLIRSEHYRLYFSLICILMAVRVVMILELPFIIDMNLNGLTMARMDFLNIYFYIYSFKGNTYSPEFSFIFRGTPSPVSVEVSTKELPLITMPSSGIFSPGFTIITSPMFTLSGETFFKSPFNFRFA